jgi:Flp pilus assembly protein TadG
MALDGRARVGFAAVRRRIARFCVEQRGAVTVEFVVAVPLLMAVLAFAVQYGYAMQVRNALDVAVRDAARYMSRAPIDPATGTVDTAFLDKASELVRDRIKASATVTVNDMRITEDLAAIRATASVQLPLLAALLPITGGTVIDRIDMVSCEGWSVSESRDSGGVLAESLSGAPFANCPDTGLAAVAGAGVAP